MTPPSQYFTPLLIHALKDHLNVKTRELFADGLNDFLDRQYDKSTR